MSDVVQQLKRYKPASLKAVLRDGTDRPVAVPKSGNRWQRCERTLESLDWMTVECLDKDGRVIGVVEQEDADDDIELAEGNPDAALARILLDVMRTTQKETRQMFEVQLRGQAELVQALIDGVRSIADSYSLAMKVQATNAAMPQDGDPEMMQMMKMAMALHFGGPKPQLPTPPRPTQTPQQTDMFKKEKK